MIGRIVMDISQDQMVEIVEHYWNCRLAYLENQKAKVVKVRQRRNGRFIIDLDGSEKRLRPVQTTRATSDDRLELKAATGGGQ